MAVNPPKTKPLRQFSKVIGKIVSVAEAAPRCSGGRWLFFRLHGRHRGVGWLMGVPVR
jgi:hypothetical protein